MIKKQTWILVGVFFWGIPTAAIFSLVLSFVRPGEGVEIQQFNQGVFVHNLMIFIPMAVFIGVLLGLLMFRLSRKYSK